VSYRTIATVQAGIAEAAAEAAAAATFDYPVI